MLRRIITAAIVIVIAFYLLTQPAAASHVVHNVLDVPKHAGQSLANFVNGF